MMGVIAGQGYHQYEGRRERGPGELEEPGVLCGWLLESRKESEKKCEEK